MIEHPSMPGPSPTPKGDMTVVSITAIVLGAIVVVWYFTIIVAGTVLYFLFISPYQIVIWLLAVAAGTCGWLSLNARMRYGLATAGFIAGVTAVLLAITVGLLTEYQIVL